MNLLYCAKCGKTEYYILRNEIDPTELLFVCTNLECRESHRIIAIVHEVIHKKDLPKDIQLL